MGEEVNYQTSKILEKLQANEFSMIKWPPGSVWNNTYDNNGELSSAPPTSTTGVTGMTSGNPEEWFGVIDPYDNRHRPWWKNHPNTNPQMEYTPVKGQRTHIYPYLLENLLRKDIRAFPTVGSSHVTLSERVGFHAESGMPIFEITKQLELPAPARNFVKKFDSGDYPAITKGNKLWKATQPPTK